MLRARIAIATLALATLTLITTANAQQVKPVMKSTPKAAKAQPTPKATPKPATNAPVPRLALSLTVDKEHKALTEWVKNKDEGLSKDKLREKINDNCKSCILNDKQEASNYHLKVVRRIEVDMKRDIYWFVFRWELTRNNGDLVAVKDAKESKAMIEAVCSKIAADWKDHRADAAVVKKAEATPKKLQASGGKNLN